MSTYGFPDGQEITQWLGQPLAEQTGLVLGGGTHSDGPFSLANFASVILAIAPTVQKVTVKLTQAVSGGPASLKTTTQFDVPAGSVLFEAVVLFADQVTLELDGGGAGCTVDYALYPSNTTTNAQLAGTVTASVPRVTTLPANPADQALVSFVPDAVNFPGVEWLLMFNSATGWWDVLGGPPLYDNDDADYATPNTAAWTNLSAHTLTLAHEGYYDCRLDCTSQNTFASAAEALVGLSIDGVTPASDSDAADLYTGAAGPLVSVTREYFNKHVAAGGVVRVVYKSQQTSSFHWPRMRVMPRRIK